MKYIDAEKITCLLDAKYKEFVGKAKIKGYTTLQYQYMADGIDIAEQLIDSLQQEQQEKKKVKFVFPKFLYARTTNNKTIDVSYAPQSLDAIEYIRSDSIQQEQSEVDFEKELKNERAKLLDMFGPMNGEQSLAIRNFARHFVELGLNARKVE